MKFSMQALRLSESVHATVASATARSRDDPSVPSKLGDLHPEHLLDAIRSRPSGDYAQSHTSVGPIAKQGMKYRIATAVHKDP